MESSAQEQRGPSLGGAAGSSEKTLVVAHPRASRSLIDHEHYFAAIVRASG